ncbi:MAG: amylo-alpha-1,6-glucosidase [Candidatus Nanoarchaeia archaeon]
MITLVHKLRKDIIEKDVDDAHFLLTNKKGGYVYFSNNPVSKYQGVFFNHKFRMFKTIDNINLPVPVTKVINKFCSVVRERGIVTEEFFMPHNFDSFVYTVANYDDFVTVDLDCRESYEGEGLGRIYNIYPEQGKLVVEFIKGNSYRFFLVVGGFVGFENIRHWKQVFYPLDQKRNSDAHRYVYSAFKLKGSRFVFSFSMDKYKAMKECSYVLNNYRKLMKKQERSLIYKTSVKSKELRMAYNACLNSLNSLLVNIDDKFGLFAGLPWFFQIWSRDEMVSLKALSKIINVKPIVDRTLASILPDGSLPNRFPPSSLESADSIGWFYCRVGKPLRIKEVAQAQLKYHTKDAFAINGPLDTWMDTVERPGARIEIQAIRLLIYKLLGNVKIWKDVHRTELDEEGAYVKEQKREVSGKELERELRDKVKERFWNRIILFDGLNDQTIRPNIFIAAYIYPDLLSKKEWVFCFRNALPRLWNEWGGLATIDKYSPSFVDTYTGETNLSYHNGDSWFWLNNMAALLMFKYDRAKFKPYIEKILEASTHEILYSGMVGHHAELSSSRSLDSNGCLAQAWSSALFVELVDAMKK